jgi:putative transposase
MEIRKGYRFLLKPTATQAELVVSPSYTSLECSDCHHKDQNNRVNQATFLCVKCHHEEHADVNAAKNILVAGRATLACGDIIKQSAA